MTACASPESRTGVPLFATRLLAAALLSASVCVTAPAAQAGEGKPGERPRIGLALSGGGARGLAHVGVLKVLEELRVPVHCVTGTSMGAIVAGTYASGMPMLEMESMVLAADWGDVFRDQPPRKEIASRRKQDDYKTLFAPEFGLKDGEVVAPKGIVAGVAIEAFFRDLTRRAAGISDFSELPVPFRAVAADIETGEAVVLRHGSVAHAMRASMSVPGAMAPVEIDGRLLVDGGIANNLPIDEVRKLCADVVIAVNISTPPLTREQITSAVSVTAQLINFLGKPAVDRQLQSLTERDVLIAPDLGDISAGRFSRAADAIRIGEQAARSAAVLLGRYSLPAEQYAALRARQIRPSTDVGSVDEIRFEGLRRTNPEVLKALVHSKPGEPLTEDLVSADLRRIYGRGDFDAVNYRIDQGPGGRALVIQPREKERGPNYLRFGLGLASDFKGENNFAILGQYRQTWLNHLGGEWLTEAQIGNNPFLSTEFFQPVDERGRYFVAPYARLSQDVRGVFLGEEKVAEYRIREGRVGLDTGAVLGTWGEARLGALWGAVDAERDTGSPLLPDLKEETAGLRAFLYIDQLDHPYFARDGMRVGGSAYLAEQAMGSERNYRRLEGSASFAKSVGAHTLYMSMAGGTNLGSDLPAYESFTLGGPLRLSAYRIGQFSGRRMVYGRLMYYNRSVELPDFLGSGVYAGAALEAGQIHSRFDGLPAGGTIWSGSVFLGADTFVGPAYLGFAVGEAGNRTLYLLLGAP